MIILLQSCGGDKAIENFDADTAVVEAYIYANQPVDSIRITKAIAFSENDELIPIDDLNVTFNDGSNDIQLESIGDGYYQNLEHIIQEDLSYTLSFDYNGKLVSATTYVNASIDITIAKTSLRLEKIEFGGIADLGRGGAQSEVIDISWDNSDLSYYFVDVEHVEDEQEYVNGIFDFAEEQGVELPEQFFRTEPSIRDFYALDSNRELQFFGSYEITIYRLNAEYAVLYESVGSPSLSLAEPPSNVVNGLGIFSAITSHKLGFEVIKI